MAKALLHAHPLQPEHLLTIEPQDSQRQQYGLETEITPEHAAAMAAHDNCWAILRSDLVVACVGITETFAGVQGVAWALLASKLGRDIVPVTQFTRDVMIARSPLQRIEAIVRCAEPEPAMATDPEGLLAYALHQPTRQVSWAMKVGLQPVAVLRKFGAAGEAHLLMERVT